MSYLKFAIQALCELNFDPIDEVLNNAKRANMKLQQHLLKIQPEKDSPDYEDYCEYGSAEIDKEDVNRKAAVQLSIVGLYLTLEIGMTKLVRLCFDDIPPKKLRTFENFAKELLKKGIDVTLLPDFQSIDILREINNSIKHSESIEPEKAEKISDFVVMDHVYQENKLNSVALESGYSGFKRSVLSFFNALREECTNKLPGNSNGNGDIV